MSEDNFNHVNLADVNPDNEVIPDATYNLGIGKAELKSWKNDKGEGSFISLSLVIKDHPEFTGRRLFQPALFYAGKNGNFDSRVLKQLRRIMDATGVMPSGDFANGQDLVDYLNAVRQSGATFSAPVKTVEEIDKRDNSPRKRTSASLYEAAVAA